MFANLIPGKSAKNVLVLSSNRKYTIFGCKGPKKDFFRSHMIISIKKCLWYLYLFMGNCEFPKLKSMGKFDVTVNRLYTRLAQKFKKKSATHPCVYSI